MSGREDVRRGEEEDKGMVTSEREDKEGVLGRYACDRVIVKGGFD